MKGASEARDQLLQHGIHGYHHKEDDLNLVSEGVYKILNSGLEAEGSA